MPEEMKYCETDPREMTLSQLLGQVCRMTGSRMRVHLERLGLHRGQGFALVHLWHHDGVPQHELSRAMHIRPASVTMMLKRMERAGWITRERDPDDQRVVRVFLSAKARELRSKAQMVFRDVEEEFCSIYTDDEQETLKQLLTKLHDRFSTDVHCNHTQRFLCGAGDDHGDTT